MTSTMRARTEPAPSGSTKSVMRHHDYDLEDDGILMVPRPERNRIGLVTPEEQNALDEKARKQATEDLVNSWQERLHVISAMATFFALTEATLLVATKPEDRESGVLKASNASLLGALIIHVYAAILSFFGAFLLVRDKLKEATCEEMTVEGIEIVNSPLGEPMHKDDGPNLADLTLRGTLANSDIATAMEVNGRKSPCPVEPPITSANPHIAKVGLFTSAVSSHLLGRTHTLCVFLTTVGSVLAIAGIVCRGWALQPIEVCVFASAVLGGVVLAIGVLLI